MASSKRVGGPPSETFGGQALALAWGAWVELGVSGWTASHRSWAIDPEPLIIFTAFLEDADRRLRDEATDWCIHNWRYLSKTRLKNLARDQPTAVRDAFGVFAATVGEHAAISWPGATEPRPYTVTGRSKPPHLDQPSMVWLRLRAMFGLSARSEILRYFLGHEGDRASVARIAAATNYTKRNIAEECETLERAGLLTVRTIGNRFSYSLARRAQLEALVGALPEIRPDWAPMLNIARELVELEKQAESSTSRTLAVKARKTVDRIVPDLDALGIETPGSAVKGVALWPAIQALGAATLGVWSIGQWHEVTGRPTNVESKVSRLPSAR